MFRLLKDACLKSMVPTNLLNKRYINNIYLEEFVNAPVCLCMHICMHVCVHMHSYAQEGNVLFNNALHILFMVIWHET